MIHAWSDYKQDRSKYSGSAWVTHRSLWAVAAYRLARGLRELPNWARPLLMPISLAFTLFARATTNIEIPTDAVIGPGLLIRHAGPIVIHRDARIGSDALLITGVVIGSRGTDEAPVIGDRVRFGVYAVVIGPVTVGDDASIGAMSLVTADVPAGQVVAGIPARIV